MVTGMGLSSFSVRQETRAPLPRVARRVGNRSGWTYGGGSRRRARARCAGRGRWRPSAPRGQTPGARPAIPPRREAKAERIVNLRQRRRGAVPTGGGRPAKAQSNLISITPRRREGIGRPALQGRPSARGRNWGRLGRRTLTGRRTHAGEAVSFRSHFETMAYHAKPRGTSAGRFVGTFPVLSSSNPGE